MAFAKALRSGLNLFVAACAALLVLAASALADTTIDFDSSPPPDNQILSTDYDAQGLDFPGNGASLTPPGYTSPVSIGQPAVVTMSTQGAGVTAHSGTRALELDPEQDEFPEPWLEGSFTMTTHQAVSLWVRAPVNSEDGTVSLTMQGYDASDARLTGVTATVNVPASGTWTPIGITEGGATADIARFTLTPTNPSFTSSKHYYVDDVTFDTPPPSALTPSFSLTPSQFLPLAVTQNSSGTVAFRVQRLNGSTGALHFSTDNVPDGETISYSENPLPPSDSTETITVHSADDAPPVDTPVTLQVTATGNYTGGPGSPATGADRQSSFELTVNKLCDDPSYGILKLAPIDGGCFHPNGDNTYSYQGTQLRINGMVAGVSGFAVDENTHTISAALFTLAPTLNLGGGASATVPLFAGPLDLTVPVNTSGPVTLFNISSAAIGQMLSPFTAPLTHALCGSSGSGSSGSGSSADSRDPRDSDDSGSSCNVGAVTDAVNLTSTGAQAPLELKLPPALGGLTADLTLKWKTATGYDPNAGFKFALDSLPLGPVTLQGLSLQHSGTAAWTGSATVAFAPPIGFSVGGTLGFDQTGLTELSVTASGLHIPFVAGSFLTTVGIGYHRYDSGVFTYGFDGSLGVSWGPQVGGKPLAEIDGQVSFDFGNLNTPVPNRPGQTYWPFFIQVMAELKIAGYQIGQATLVIAQDATGPTFRVDVTVGIGFPYNQAHPTTGTVQLNGGLTFWVQPPNFEGDAHVGVKLFDIPVLGAELLISNIGVGGCGTIGPFSGGFGFRWGQSVQFQGPFGCDISGYAPPYRQQGPGGAADIAAASGSHSFNLSGSKPDYLKLYSRAGTPHVTLTGPGGRKLTMAPGTGSVHNNSFLVGQDPTSHLTVIGINHPAGKWTLTPESGSPPLTKVLAATTLPPPHVTGKLSGSGRTRTLAYRIGPLPKQTVQFVEVGSHTHRVIATAHHLHGRIKFTPGTGPAGARTIDAVVYENSVPQKQFVVAHYRAPKALAPTDPASVKLVHSGGNVVVSWKPGTDVADYRVSLTLSDGVVRFEQLPAGRRLASFGGVPANLTAVATVQAQRLNGGLGKVISSNAKPKPKKHKKHTGGSHKR